MIDINASNSLVPQIEEYIDTLLLEAPIEYEGINVDAAKYIAIYNAIESHDAILADTGLSEHERNIAVKSTLAYLLLENTLLWILNKRNNNEETS